MNTETTVPYYKELDAERTQGEWQIFDDGEICPHEVHLMVDSTGNGKFDKPISNYSLSMNKQGKANALYTALSVNNLAILAQTLEYVLEKINTSENWWMDCPDSGGFDTVKIEAALEGISKKPL